MNKKIYLYLIVMVTLFFLTYIRLQTSIHNYLVERLFLDLHQNYLAIKVLKNLPTNKKNFYTHFLLGRIYFVENDLYNSVNNYNIAIAQNPDEKQNYYGRGLSYGFMGGIFLDEAAVNFQKYIELDNLEFKKTGRHAYGAWAGYNDLAWIHFLKGDFKSQEEVAREGLAIASGNAWLQNILGVALLAQGKCNQAQEHLAIAQILADKKTAKEFGEAYSGDNPSFWKQGLEDMRKVIGENSKLCEKN